MSDRSLDEFAGASSPADEADESDDDEPTDEVEEGDDADDPSATPGPDPDPDPDATDTPTPTLTMRWSSTPVACDDCGAAVSRRWRAASGSSGDDFVCADCKEW